MRRTSGAISILLAVALVLIALSLFATGCNREQAREEGGTETAIEPSLEVTGVTLGRAVGANNRIVDETSTFHPEDTIYASVSTEGVAPSASLTARWSFEDGQVVDETSLTIAPNGPEITEFHVSKPDGLPVGSYEVVILLNGDEVDSQSFRVEAGM